MFCKTIFKNSFVFTIAIGLVLAGYLRNPAQVSKGSGFDINKVPIVNPKLGEFPYFSLIEGYKLDRNIMFQNVDVGFDRYELFDGTRIFTVEGRLKTIIASGSSASPYEILKTYESLVKDLGGVTVFEGDSKAMKDRGLEFKERRSRTDVSHGDRFGVYVVRTPKTEIWVEAYTVDWVAVFKGYHLTVIETKPLKVRATLLTAEEMKKELDTKGKVDVNIDFEDDKPEIKPKSKPTIDEVAKLMKKNPRMNLTVKGRSNKNGTRENNRKLSEARANSVVKALTARGIPASRLKAVGIAQDRETGDPRAEAGSDGVELVKSN
jgi:OmpA-OmpF porin, OOP family